MWKLKNSNMFAVALIYIAFFTLIGVAVYVTKSGTPLWGLILMPSYEPEN